MAIVCKSTSRSCFLSRPGSKTSFQQRSNDHTLSSLVSSLRFNYFSMTKETKSVVQHLDGAQRTKSDAEVQAELPDRFDEGKSQKGAHKNDDPKDERSIANRLAAGSAANTKDKVTDEDKGEASLKPTQRAEMHGNEPSKGAVMDEQIEAEEAAELRKKGKA